MAIHKEVDPIRARKRRTDKLQANLNGLQVLVITRPMALDILDILVELTDAALRVAHVLPPHMAGSVPPEE